MRTSVGSRQCCTLRHGGTVGAPDGHHETRGDAQGQQQRPGRAAVFTTYATRLSRGAGADCEVRHESSRQRHDGVSEPDAGRSRAGDRQHHHAAGRTGSTSASTSSLGVPADIAALFLVALGYADRQVRGGRAQADRGDRLSRSLRHGWPLAVFRRLTRTPAVFVVTQTCPAGSATF